MLEECNGVKRVMIKCHVKLGEVEFLDKVMAGCKAWKVAWVMLCWHRWWITPTWHRGNCVKVAYVAGTKLEDKSEWSPKPFAFSLRIRKPSVSQKSLSLRPPLNLPPSASSHFKALSLPPPLSLALSQSQPPLHSRSLHFRSLHSRSRSLSLSLRSLSAFFVWAKGSFFISFSFEKRVKVALLSDCSCKRMFFLFVEWFACKVLFFMRFFMEKEVFLVVSLFCSGSEKVFAFMFWFLLVLK